MKTLLWALFIPSIAFAQTSLSNTMLETTISSEFTLLRRVPDKDSSGTTKNKGDTVKLSFLTEGPDYGLTMFWKLSTGGYIKDESLTQTPAMIEYKKKAMILINKRIDHQFKKLDSVNAIKTKKEQDEIAKLDKVFGSKYGTLVYYNMIWIGMTDIMAEYSIGKPDRINRSTYSWGVEEQWVYDRKVYRYNPPLYLYFSNSKLTSYQESR